jgi:hypothetical protein
MEIKRRTPRTDLVLSGILVKMGELLKPLAEELGAPEYSVDEALTAFARISVRASFDKDVDFDLIQPGDGVEQIRAKFSAYLDTQHMGAVQAALLAIHEMDRPVNPDTAPELEGEAGKL